MALRPAAHRRDRRAARPVSAHAPGCVRGDWLLVRPKVGLFWTLLFMEGPACDCGAGPTVQPLNSPGPVTEGAPLAPTGVNSQVGGVAAT